ncbi:leucine-rich repeat-containing protein 15-like [Branchiostoma lanceolatum]|uniref:leucine-rich repeat-containing protein 15-like n=1 Tax=Branchiostoma lanceolatum TaxID=7740 RepID=UPI003453FFF1
MGRKPQHMLIFLLIILKELQLPGAADHDCCAFASCTCNSLNFTSIPQNLKTSIYSLYLKSNLIETLSQSDFTKYGNLIILDLESNHISQMMNRTFENMTKLTSLELGKNRLTSLQADMFVGLSKLEILSLYDNDISSIEVGTFSPSPKLQNLFLHSNNLTAIPQGVFDGLNQIQILHLHINHIELIPPHTFTDHKQLETLYLSANEISTIPPTAFVNQTQLQVLYLHSNKITNIYPGTFSNLKQLQKLHLNTNQINKVIPGTFSNLTQLQELYLHYNHLSNIQPGTFSDLRQLKQLYLQFNQITNIQFGTFSDLPQLLRLYLYANKITTIHPDSFQNLPKLQRLYLHLNEITAFHFHTFSNLTNLQKFYLQSNQLSVLPPSAYGMLASIPVVKIDDNPWQCDCRMAPFRQKMSGSLSVEDKITCAQPPTFSGRKLKDINLEDLKCKELTISTVSVDIQGSHLVSSAVSTFDTTASNAKPTIVSPVASVFASQPVDIQAPLITSSAVSELSSFGKTASNAAKTVSPLGSTFGTLPLETQWKSATMANATSPDFPLTTTGTSSEKESVSYMYHGSDPSFSLVVLIASVGGAVAGTVLIGCIIFTIWYMRRAKNPLPSLDPPVVVAKADHTAIVITESHDQAGQGQPEDISDRYVKCPVRSDAGPIQPTACTSKTLDPPKTSKVPDDQPPPLPPKRAQKVPTAKNENTPAHTCDNVHIYQTLEKP